MIRISSSLTLGLSIFIPVFWYMFFGCFTLFFLFTSDEDLPFSNPNLIRIIILLFFVVFGFLIYYSLTKLKRVEMDHDFLYVTNFFKTIKIPISQIKKVKSFPLFGFIRVKIILQTNTIFGTKIRFICDSDKYHQFNNRINTGSLPIDPSLN